MTRATMLYLFAMVLPGASALAQTSSHFTSASGSEIRKILQDRVDSSQGVGIVVGVIDQGGRRVVSYGGLGKGDKRPLNGDTIFEIGSITKVFTALLLADMANRGEVALADPVGKFLPVKNGELEVSVPELAGQKISLQDLANHTSGLPRLPGNLVIKSMDNPYADYSVEQLYKFLSSYKLTRGVGSQYEYTNLGGGLLGHALARHAGMGYEALVRSRICEPLAMRDTRITLTPEMLQRFAAGHNDKLNPVPAWDIPTLAGAGALRSSVNDLLKFLAASLGYAETPLASAMREMPTTRKPTGRPGLEIALGWHILQRGGAEIIWHNGGTGGYRSFIGYSPKLRAGVAVLSNTSISVDDIGFRLLSPPLPVTSRKEVTIDAKVLDTLVGRFQLAPNFILTITREGNRLFVQATGQPRAELFAETEKKFFLKLTDAQITFETGEDARATHAILHQNGKDLRAKRIEGEAPEPKERKEATIDPKLLDGYVGRYQLAPNVTLTVTREENRLYAQVTGQPVAEIFPESEREFFYKVVDAQITFEADGTGKTAQLTLHQNGMKMPAKRVE